MPAENEKNTSGRGLTQKIYAIVISLQTSFKYVEDLTKQNTSDTKQNTKDIQTLNENQHAFITKTECEKCRQKFENKEQEEEKREQLKRGWRHSDKISWRGIKATLVISCISISTTTLFFILNYFK